MPDALIQKERAERRQGIELKLLEQVAENNGITQAEFAKQIGIAKGLANAYFNRCLQKGWIKLRQVPKQRFLYYLTPKGFAEKANLTAQFLSSSYQFYREARKDLRETMMKARAEEHSRIVVLGDSELAEIAAIVADEVPIAVEGFIAAESKRDRIAGRPVVSDWAAIDGADAALLASVLDARAVYTGFTRTNSSIPVYVPAQLSALIWDK